MGEGYKSFPGLISWSFHILILVLSAALIAVVYYNSIDSEKLFNFHRNKMKNYTVSSNETSPSEKLFNFYRSNMKNFTASSNETYPRKENASIVENPLMGCDLFSGKWVYDNKSYPLYRDRNCNFMFDDLACEKYGRKDLEYQYWSWKPYDCDLPRFNAQVLLQKLRNKRLVFVGDSLNRNQWVSMVCMVESSIPEASKYRRLNGSLYTFKAIEYNVSIDFYWAPLLLESNSDDPSNHRLSDRIVRIRNIEKHAKEWGDADFLIFNSYLWWKVPKLKVLIRSFGTPNPVYKEVEYRHCYEMALKTWSDWLDVHLDRTKTRVFFVSMSPTHSRSEYWGKSNGMKCLNEREPISREAYKGSDTDLQLMRIAENAITKLKVKGINIRMLNITQLSEYRKDGHPSIYRKQWRPLTKEQLSNPINYADCTHWCLPGVPDVWNEILYTYIVNFQ